MTLPAVWLTTTEGGFACFRLATLFSWDGGGFARIGLASRLSRLDIGWCMLGRPLCLLLAASPLPNEGPPCSQLEWVRRATLGLQDPHRQPQNRKRSYQ